MGPKNLTEQGWVELLQTVASEHQISLLGICLARRIGNPWLRTWRN